MWPAIERNEDDRTAFKMLIGEHFRADQVVVADESHFNRLSTRRNFAWAPCGERAWRQDFFIRGQK